MRYRDFIQNITITFLALLSLFLFSRTQFFQLGAAAGSGTWQRLTAPVSDQISDAPASDTLSAPVRAAVTGEYGRYGSISLTTDSESFTPIKTLLREVLGSARSRMDSSAAAFRSALGKPSVYCDFLEPLPVSYLADLMGITAESELSVRALAAAEQNGQVVLLLWDGGSRYYQCVTAVQPSTLTEVLDHFELGVTAFAFEDLSGYGQHLAPLSLFPDPLPELPQLTVTESTVSTETLLSVLGFNPHTNSRYTDAGGAEVVVEGDRVIRIGSTATEDNDAVKQALEAAQGGAVEVVYVRSGEQRQTSLTPVWDASSAQWRAGMWVRDSSAGVGTLTFADEEKGVFAGLGHPISDSDTGESIALRSGEIVPCQITGCSKGTAGSPGELKGRFLSAHAIGTIRINGENGVYGSTRAQFAGQKMEVAFAQEVEAGDAEIWTTTAGETPRAYRVKIEKISDADPRRNMVLRVVDRELLAQTGGIVQGMSGSPILQNGRLVGAVTHVLVNDPTRGYGIFAQTMLEQAHSVPGTDAAA